jgi:hypothetical protein
MAQDLVSSTQVIGVCASVTANTTILAQQGAGTSIVVRSFRMEALTTTTNQVVALKDSATSTNYFRNEVMATKGAVIQYNFEKGWWLTTNATFAINLATTGAIMITAEVDVVAAR